VNSQRGYCLIPILPLGIHGAASPPDNLLASRVKPKKRGIDDGHGRRVIELGQLESHRVDPGIKRSVAWAGPPGSSNEDQVEAVKELMIPMTSRGKEGLQGGGYFPEAHPGVTPSTAATL